MIAVSSPSRPTGIGDEPYTDQTAVLLCSDLSDSSHYPVPAAEIAAAVRGRAPRVRVFVVENLCSSPAGFTSAVRALEARRVTIGCRDSAARHDEIVAQLRKAGIHRSGIRVVDLRPAEQSDPLHVAGQSAARILAAIARVSHADLDAPVHECPVGAAGPVSRRNLLHVGSLSHRPVACWIDGRCDGSGCRRACVAACPHGALRLTGSGVAVDPAACTGCGACLGTCRSDAMTLSGWSIRETEAAASVLIAEARRLGPASVRGVAIVCARAVASVPVGGNWLPLEVASLEMASAGWPLQILSAGVAVAIIGCDDDACARHGRELDSLCAALAGSAAPGWRRLNGRFACWEPASSSRSDRKAAGPAAPLELREPAATAAALSALVSRASEPATQTPGAAVASTSLPAGADRSKQWRIESLAAPIGEITVDAARCSACGSCAHACPTGALKATYRDQPALVLSVDASECFACGVCVASCPESAVSLRRVLDSVSLAAGRRPVGEVVAGGRCVSCGRPLAGGLASSVVGRRLATSHPEIAARLRHAVRCTDCLLVARVPGQADLANLRR